MFIPASSEFVALCKSQVAVLTQGLGAALSAVYLTEELVEGTQAKLIPVVVYPEKTGVWEKDDPDLVWPELQGKVDTIPRLSRAIPRLLPQRSNNDQTADSTSPDWEDNGLRRQRQVVLPLIQEGVVMGLLVTSREDRPWNEKELATIERIARTLTLAYIMDQRRVWVEQQLAEQRRLVAQRRDHLDDLLHQVRNPLTALRTFGKLLFKRLLPEDKNRELASSIVRESDRMQELLKEFDACLDDSETEESLLSLPPATLPAATSLVTRDNQGEIVPAANSLLPASSLPLESFSLATVLEPLIESAGAIAQERNLELQAQISTDLPPVRGNIKGLREVLSNLIDNALKYTPQGGEIHIQADVFARTPEGKVLRRDESVPQTVGSVAQPTNTVPLQPQQRLAILISDTGPGIPSQDLEHLFERHYRGVQAATAIPGSGLGLAIAKQLIEQMQGEIEVYSPGQPAWAIQNSASEVDQAQDKPARRGTTFVVWLSIAQE